MRHARILPPARRTFLAFNAVLMVLLTFICVVPVIHVIMASFSDPRLLYENDRFLFAPKGFTLRGYEIIFSNTVLLGGFANTVVYIVAGGALSIGLNAVSAYCLSRKNVLWSNAIMLFISFTLIFSGGLIPLFIVVLKLGIYNTRWAILLPAAISVFNIIILRTALREIPDSLEESATIDGAGHFTIMTRVILPLAKPTLAVLILFYAVGMWNSWFSAAVFLRSRSLYPLQLILREILVQNDTTQVIKSSIDAQTAGDLYKPLIKYCTIVVTTLPVLFFYPFAQKYFVTGVMLGSIKG